jgi:hypothetical protein
MSHRQERPCTAGLRLFYRHLVVSCAVQLGVLIVAVAPSAVDALPATALGLATLSLAAHASVTLGPLVNRECRGPRALTRGRPPEAGHHTQRSGDDRQ